MNYSTEGLKLTEGFEGFRNKAYPDMGGKWTIGYGHTHNVKPGDMITKDQGEVFLKEDIEEAVKTVNHLVTYPMTQGQFDAMVDFTFNLGMGNFASSTLLKKFNAGDVVGARTEFIKWNKIHGVVVDGLTRRCEARQVRFDQM